jgi:SOS-response transcriptional repressor LexA
VLRQVQESLLEDGPEEEATSLLPLTPVERRTLMYVAFRIDTDRPPSYQEIADYFGMKSRGWLHTVLKNLARKGYLHRDKKLHRALRLTPAYKEYRDQWQSRRKQKPPN